MPIQEKKIYRIFSRTSCHIYHEGKGKCSDREKVGWKVVSVGVGMQRCVGLTIKKGFSEEGAFDFPLGGGLTKEKTLTEALQVALVVKKPPANKGDIETQIPPLDQEDPLEEGMTTHFITRSWRVPRTEEPGRLTFIGSQRVRHDWSNLARMHELKMRRSHPETGQPA